MPLVLVEPVIGRRGLGNDLLDRGSHGEHRGLRHEPDPEPLAARAGPVVRRLDPGEDLEDGRLAGAVRPHQADMVPLVQGEGEPLEEGRRAERLGEAFATEKDSRRHAPPRGRRGHGGPASREASV
jgi:hypothetical protein